MSPRPRGVAPLLAAAFTRGTGSRLPLRIRAWDGSEAGPDGGPVLVVRPAAVRRLLTRPDELGVARAYVTGELDVAGDLGEALRCLRALLGGPPARPTLMRAVGRLARGLQPPAPTAEAHLDGQVNSPARDAAAIAHHYDLSNRLYALFMDATMAYSCAYFADDGDEHLVDAQRAKLDLVCHKLGLEAGHHLLDVGCGWGALSLHAAERYGARVTAVTLSGAQRDHVATQVADRGLADRVSVHRLDYREVDVGRFDAVASIEMGEHVGAANYPAFARRLCALLRPGGRLLVQQMSRRRGEHPGGGPFIETYIAPDMHMRPVGDTIALLEDAGLEVRDVQAMREHYVRTIRAWHAEFERRWPEVVDLVGEQVARVWRLYLVGGAMAFEQGRMGVDQVLAVRPLADGRSGMPWRLPAAGRA